MGCAPPGVDSVRRLTDAGSVFFDDSEIDAAKADASGLSSELIGTLRVHSTPGVGQALVDFNARYPSIKVELTVRAYSVNLMDRGVDVVIDSRHFDDDESFHTGPAARGDDGPCAFRGSMISLAEKTWRRNG